MGINIAVFGAFDISSFGDLLFPVALETELKKRIRLEKTILFAPTKNCSDYAKKMEVYSYDEFEIIHKKYNFDALIIGGGELLHNRPIEFTGSDGKKIVYQNGEIWKRPFAYAKKFKLKMLINSVGMPYEITDQDKSLLAKADYISFRDCYSYKRFIGDAFFDEIKLVPDSLWNLDEYYQEFFRNNTGEDKYIALQIGTLDNWQQMFESIFHYAERNKLKIILFAINWCHSDREVVDIVKNEYGAKCEVLDCLLKPEEIITVISGAELYVGTSFHGALVAFLSRVPVLMYNMYPNFVSKMDGLAAWTETQDALIESVGQLQAALEYDRIMRTKPSINEIKNALKLHFDEMAEIITAENSVKSKLNITQLHGIQFERSFFEWKDASGKKAFSTVISERQGELYFIEIPVKGRQELYWYVPTMEFVEIKVDSNELLPVNVDEKGRCFDRLAQFKVVTCKDKMQFHYSKVIKKQTEDFRQLLLRYRDREAHIELLLESERRYQRKLVDVTSKLDEIEKDYKIQKEQKIELEQKNQVLTDYIRQETQNLKQEIKNKEGHIEQLLEVEREYEREKKSRTYRIALTFRRISTFFLPVNSKRRFFVKMFLKGLRHPRLMLHMINIRRIRNFFDIVKKEGMDGINYHYKLVEDFENSKLNPFDADQFEITRPQEEKKSIDDYEKLVFQQYEQYEVSIVIPVYNQFHYTYNCLYSILKNSGDVKYEIIVADDCSSDLTKELKKIVEGIHIIRNEKNLRFLLNCNHAASQAGGKYILFLNNDTQVQPNWLRPLVDLLDKNDSIGMTGSKLVYADGHLQEAGGIFWKDASAWNYGNRKNPDDPEFNYVKEADYISGASILIRRSLWNEIGGFDERFAPAYYEDSDLAFEVRKRGYKVVYQPQSVVVHFEGISNGTDVTSGQKAYQVANQKKFYEKWKTVLEKEHFVNGENVFLAKDRSRFKKQILVVDHYVPHYDKDAGGKCTYMYLLLFVRMGFKVTFIGDNYFKHEPYTTDLNQHGIEVLYGNYYFENWQAWLKENLHYFDYVYLQRPHISIKYIDLVKEYSHAKILYFAHDLHHVREYREYQLTGDEEKKKSSEHWKKIEYELFEKADVGHVVGTYEQGVMQKAFPQKPIRNIPLYIYEDILNNINKDFTERKDLIYVGGFGHPPNIDAVLWFGKEVFPRIVRKYSDIKWHVVGGKVPLEIQEMASENLIIEGFLSDEALHELYKTCRIAVVPLRVGAGVKGKVVEAAYYQIPLVTTTIGAEGLSREEGNMLVEDDAGKMADLICDLYEDYGRLKRMSDAGVSFIQKYFTEEEAERVLLLDIEK